MVKKRDLIRIKISTQPKKIDDEEDPLQKQFKSLEKKWNSIRQQSNSRTNGRYSTGESSSILSGDYHLLQLININDSPKELVSSLQQEKTPNSEGHMCSLKQEDMAAAVEIIKEREAAFENSGLKGRRLFEEPETDSDESEGVCSNCLNLVQESGVKSVSSYKGSDFINGENSSPFSSSSSKGSDFINGGNSSPFSNSSSVTGGREMSSGNLMAAEKRGCRNGGGGGGSCGGGMVVHGGRWRLNLAWVGGVIMILFTFGIAAMKSNGGDEAILVPT